jgi:hypothetical protein
MSSLIKVSSSQLAQDSGPPWQTASSTLAPVFTDTSSSKFWRPDAYSIAGTAASSFCIERVKSDAYRRSLPLAEPKLETDEEFPVIRSKRRPLVLLSDLAQPIKEQFVAQDKHLCRKVAVFAPVYGVLKKDGTAKFSSVMIDRIRKLEYPHLFFLPKTAGALTEDSILRFDYLQTLFLSHLEAYDFRLNDDILQIVDGILRFLFLKSYEGNYKILRDELIPS